MGNYNFKKDLPEGQKAEKEAIEKLKKYYSIDRDDDFQICNTTDFDIKIVSKNISFEVKNDLMAERTGNVAIEYESRGKLSGISVTKADFWIYKFTGLFFMFETEKIKRELLVNQNFHKKVTGGDYGSNTKMYLVKVNEFKTWGIELC